LAISKSVFEEKLRDLDKEISRKYEAIGADYAAALNGFFKASQEVGDLDTLLIIKGEQERFQEQKRVAAGQVVAAPPGLAEAQRKYLVAAGKLEEEKQAKTTKATESYLTDLESLKRSLTRMGRIDDAMAVNDEIKLLKETVVAVAPVAKPEARAIPATTGSVVVNPTGIRPLRDNLWVLAVYNGFPVKHLEFLFLQKGTSKSNIIRTDSMGKIAFHCDTDAEYQIVVLSDKYELLDQPIATAGNAYQFKLAAPQPGTGSVVVRSREFELPGAGTIRMSRWSGSSGRSGPALYAGSEIFRSGNGEPSRVVHLSAGQTFTIDTGERKYDATIFTLGDNQYYIRYRGVK
jgi:hypothetical protein